jgi:hypothetical protein
MRSLDGLRRRAYGRWNPRTFVDLWGEEVTLYLTDATTRKLAKWQPGAGWRVIPQKRGRPEAIYRPAPCP